MKGALFMTPEQLGCFLAAARENTFLEAAESLHITQSTLSKQIQKLEQERAWLCGTAAAAGLC